MHHIFPSSDFPILSDYIENIIAITPNQHFSMAHPSNSTKYIDKNFQYICLLAKTNTIIQDLQEHLGFETYSFENYIIVLNNFNNFVNWFSNYFCRNLCFFYFFFVLILNFVCYFFKSIFTSLNNTIYFRTTFC